MASAERHYGAAAADGGDHAMLLASLAAPAALTVGPLHLRAALLERRIDRHASVDHDSVDLESGFGKRDFDGLVALVVDRQGSRAALLDSNVGFTAVDASFGLDPEHGHLTAARIDPDRTAQ